MHHRASVSPGGPELVEQLMRAALGNPGSAVAAQGFLSVPGLLESQELHTMEEQGRGAEESERVHCGPT